MMMVDTRALAQIHARAHIHGIHLACVNEDSHRQVMIIKIYVSLTVSFNKSVFVLGHVSIDVTILSYLIRNNVRAFKRLLESILN